ncbi:hypothetical protein M5K25_008891 [Dendrobium thyrsiflorum]|uniref:Uncharacterized protein n=1 Tax=Dendrobium thyrsiflorum TaxID=117978 RepID=A0ABD0V9K7_DENTH
MISLPDRGAEEPCFSDSCWSGLLKLGLLLIYCCLMLLGWALAALGLGFLFGSWVELMLGLELGLWELGFSSSMHKVKGKLASFSSLSSRFLLLLSASSTSHNCSNFCLHHLHEMVKKILDNQNQTAASEARGPRWGDQPGLAHAREAKDAAASAWNETVGVDWSRHCGRKSMGIVDKNLSEESRALIRFRVSSVRNICFNLHPPSVAHSEGNALGVMCTALASPASASTASVSTTSASLRLKMIFPFLPLLKGLSLVALGGHHIVLHHLVSEHVFPFLPLLKGLSLVALGGHEWQLRMEKGLGEVVGRRVEAGRQEAGGRMGGGTGGVAAGLSGNGGGLGKGSTAWIEDVRLERGDDRYLSDFLLLDRFHWHQVLVLSALFERDAALRTASAALLFSASLVQYFHLQCKLSIVQKLREAESIMLIESYSLESVEYMADFNKLQNQLHLELKLRLVDVFPFLPLLKGLSLVALGGHRRFGFVLITVMLRRFLEPPLVNKRRRFKRNRLKRKGRPMKLDSH